MNTDAVLLAIAVIGLVTTFGITLYLVGYFRSAPEPTDSNHRPAGAAAANARQLNRGELRALRRRRQGVAAVNERAEQREQDMQAEHAENFEGEEEEDGGGPRVAGTSRKAMQKELKRQERERMRKFEASRREEVKRLREAKEEAHRKRLEAADADEDAREAELEAMRLRQEVKAKADFERWRAFMSVDDTGVDADMADDESAESERLHAVAEYVQVRRRMHRSNSRSYVLNTR
ncbi:hypothetical protein, variant [Aphanomyces invadans]|uniref:DDRGK domain-containing protein 1 n=1 Tax=Aphanomyces invadans TaxID=157072 RepID=A0A024U830_9STRA|nr:hypothetical protein, variant [Aphanomyces invadans]ETW01758.1 hypothetical protein, variant [Aphanomyces invadans]|eukprot:XP_008869606.1 hypothetical protein, variant [Aphanomyces invadans]